MTRKWMVALLALAAVGLVQPAAAFARGGGGGGHGGGGMGGHGMGGGSFHSSAIHGGFGGGGFHGGFHHGFHNRAFVGFGIGPYAYYDDYYPYYYDDGCYLVRHRVLTHYGWRIRRVQVCG